MQVDGAVLNSDRLLKEFDIGHTEKLFTQALHAMRVRLECIDSCPVGGEPPRAAAIASSTVYSNVSRGKLRGNALKLPNCAPSASTTSIGWEPTLNVDHSEPVAECGLWWRKMQLHQIPPKNSRDANW